MFVQGSTETPRCLHECLANRRVHVIAAIVTTLFIAVGIGLYFTGHPGTAIGNGLIGIGVPILALSLLMLAINYFKNKEDGTKAPPPKF